MGRATKWLKSVLGLNRSDHSSPSPSAAVTPLRVKEKSRRWGFIKSYRGKDIDFSSSTLCCSTAHTSGHDQRCAVAVASATAAAAEAAVAAAQAAAEVVRLTKGRPLAIFPSSVELAAIKIQSAFRGYFARRALRALKSLVKLQALVRGHIVRKRTTEWLQRMQALLRAQERARAGRGVAHESPNQTIKGPPTPEKHDHGTRNRSGKHDQFLKKASSRRIGLIEEHKNDKILEIDTGLGQLYHSHHCFPSEYYPRSYSLSQILAGDGESLYPSVGEAEEPFCSAEVLSESSIGGASKRSPFTPRSFLVGDSDNPNYMSNTQSSKAKVRSMSAPKQRPQEERSGSAKRFSIGFGETRSNSTQRSSSLRNNFNSKAYPGSGRLDRLGMPIRQIYRD